jgi:hypothetical protein
VNPGNEILHAAGWIHTKVGTLGGLVTGAFLDVVPKDVALPAVRYHVQNPSDVTVVEGTRVITNIDWLIVVVREGLGVAALIPLADALDVALHQQQGTIDGYHIECVRREPFNMLEPDDSGVQYRHAGGIYRTIVGPT